MMTILRFCSTRTTKTASSFIHHHHRCRSAAAVAAAAASIRNYPIRHESRHSSSTNTRTTGSGTTNDETSAPAASAQGGLNTRPPPRNPFLKQVIAQGMPHLEACTKDVIQNTRESLVVKDFGPSPSQISEAMRIHETVSSVVEQISLKSGELSIQGNPIVILDAEVSPDCKQARIFWCLPLHLCEHPDDVTEKVTSKMQEILDGRGGAKIQSHVFGRLSHYYPPKLRFVPVPVQTAITDFLQEF